MREIALPPGARLAAWAIVAAVLSMILYGWLSWQDKIAAISRQAAAAKRELADYDGAIKGVWPLVGRVMILSVQHLKLTLLPALIASLPILFLMAWLEMTYAYQMVQPGAMVEVAISPHAEAVQWTPAAQAVALDPQRWQLTWPSARHRVTLHAKGGQLLAEFPLSLPVHTIQKRRWWNSILANPAGYIPDHVNVTAERIDVGLPANEYLRFGPNWVRTWQAVFLPALMMTSIAIKVAFRIK